MQSLIALVAGPLLLFLPGYLTLHYLRPGPFSEPTSTENHEPNNDSASKGPDLVEVIGLSTAASILLSSIVAFILVLAGIFSLWLVLTVVGLYTTLAAILIARKRSFRPLLPRPIYVKNELWPVLGAIVMVGVGLGLYSGYSESILLIRDPATHVNTSIHIAKTGSSLIEDNLYYSLDEDLQTVLVYERPVDAAKSRTDGFQIEYRFRGFPRDTRLDKTTPQFFNLFPTWQAMGYEISGIKGALLTLPVFGALSVLFIFLVGRRLFGSVAGLAAAALLSINLAHLWFSRTPGSEVMFQAVFLMAVLFWALFSSSRRGVYGIFAGVAFGALTLVRIDSVLILAGIAILYIYLVATKGTRRSDLFFLLPLIAMAALGLADALYSSRPYVSLLYKTSDWATELLISLGAVAAIAALIGVVPRLGVASLLRWLEANYSTVIRLILAIGLVGLAIFAYFGRPEIQETVSINLEGTRLPKYAEESFVRLGWYISPLGLVLATIGGAIAVFRSSNRAMTLFLLTGMVVTFYYLINPRITPDHFWAARRYVPVILPMSLLFIGVVIQVIGWSGQRPWSASTQAGKPLFQGLGSIPILSPLRRLTRWIRSIRLNRILRTLIEPKIVAVGLLGTLIGLSVHQIWEFVSYRDQKGAISQIERVANKFPDDAVIVFNRSDLGELVAPPLKLVHGLETFVMGPAGASESYRTLCGPEHEYPSTEEPSSCILSKLASSIPDRPLFWVTPTPRRQPRFVQEAFQRLDGRGIRINVPRLEAPLTRLPKKSGAYPVVLTGAVFQLKR